MDQRDARHGNTQMWNHASKDGQPAQDREQAGSLRPLSPLRPLRGNLGAQPQPGMPGAQPGTAPLGGQPLPQPAWPGAPMQGMQPGVPGQPVPSQPMPAQGQRMPMPAQPAWPPAPMQSATVPGQPMPQPNHQQPQAAWPGAPMQGMQPGAPGQPVPPQPMGPQAGWQPAQQQAVPYHAQSAQVSPAPFNVQPMQPQAMPFNVQPVQPQPVPVSTQPVQPQAAPFNAQPVQPQSTPFYTQSTQAQAAPVNTQPAQSQPAATGAQAWQPRDRQPQPVPAWQPTPQTGRTAPAAAQPTDGAPVRRVWTQTVARVPAQEGMPVAPEAEVYTPYVPVPQEGPRRRRTEQRAEQPRPEDAVPTPQAEATHAVPSALPSYVAPYTQEPAQTEFDPDGWEDALPAQDAACAPEAQTPQASPAQGQTAAQGYPAPGAPAQAGYSAPVTAPAQPYPTPGAPVQTGYPAPAAADLLDDDSGRYEGVLNAKLAEPVPVPTADLRLPRRKRRVWPAVLLTLTAVVALAAALYYSGLWEQLRQATVSSPLFADIPAIFAGDQPKSATPTPALAPATQAPTVELRSATVEPAEGTAPVQLTFQVETNADASSIRLLTESGEALHIASAYGNPKGDGVLWQITADFEAAYTGKVRFFLRDQTGTWVEGALTCDVAVR